MPTPNVLGYECDCCGACCKALIVEADVIDVLREPRILECQDKRPAHAQAAGRGA